MRLREERVSAAAVQRRLGQRQQAEFVLAMAEYLPDEERLLIEQVYRDGRPVSELARMSRRSPRQLQRQVRNAVNRLSQRDFQYVVTHEALLPREMRAVARRRCLENRSLRETARVTGQSLHQVRQLDQRLQAHLQAHAQLPAASG